LYQLTNIERLINVNLGKSVFPIEELQKETSLIIQDLDNILRAQENPSRFTQLHQHKLLALMNKVVHQTKDDSLKEDIYYCLKELLDELESHSPSCLNIKAKVPSWYTTYQYSDDDIDFISDNLTKMELDHGYWTILMRPLYDLIASKVNPGQFTNRQISYLEAFNHGMKSLFISHEADLLEKTAHLLVSLNFNDERYLDFRKKELTAEIEGISDTREKMIVLHWYLSEINSIPVKANISFDDTLPSLKESLMTWLRDKIFFLEERRKLITADAVPADLLQIQHVRINVNASVDQFGCLLGMAFEKGVITNDNKKEAAAFFAHFFTTSKQGKISASSLLRKMYAPNGSVEKSVRKGLDELSKFKERE
jgi:hypothetical protein